MTTLQSGAEAEITGDVSIYVDWKQDIYFFDPLTGAAMDLSGLALFFYFRKDRKSTSADVTLSTADGTLSIVADGGSVYSILRIDVPDGTFASYPGDMIADLVAVDSESDKFHYGHGVVTFHTDPV